MRFVIFGAGAVGGVVACRLAGHGHDVAVIARGAHGEVIARSGLTIESPEGSETRHLPVAPTPAALGIRPGDVVLLAVKSQDTPAALAALREAALPSTPVVCLQNGVENERVALRMFEHVYGVCVMMPTTHLEPGVVQAYSSPVPGLLDVGRYPRGTDQTAEALATAFNASTFEALVRPDIMRWKYSKLLLNLGNAVEAACGPSSALGPLTQLVRDEGVACFRAAGIDFASDEEDAERRGDRLHLRPIAGQRRGGGSTWQSLSRGTGSVETDYLNGEIVMLGRLHGVPTPANASFQALAAELAAGHAPPGSVDADEVLTRLASASPGR